MSASAWWMLAITWGVILSFSTSLLWRVLTLDRANAGVDDEDDEDAEAEAGPAMADREEATGPRR